MIEVGFVTDIDELMRRALMKRMAVRRAAWAELTTAVAAISGIVVRDAWELLKFSCPGTTATG